MTRRYDENDVRQGVTGHRVRYVLGASVTLALVALIAVVAVI